MQETLPGLDFATTAYTLKRSRRRRRTIELSVGPHGDLCVSAPARTPKHEIDAFVRSKARWIAKALDDSRDRARHLRRDFTTGEALTYLGRTVQLNVLDDHSNGNDGPFVELIGSCLEVRVAAGLSGTERRAAVLGSVEAWCRAQAEATLSERVRLFAPLIGVQPKQVRVKRQKTRWGSCGKDGTLYINWGIVMAPISVLDYLVVHELCHLRRPGHGRAFWKLVAGVLPDFRSRRAALRRDGWQYRLS